MNVLNKVMLLGHLGNEPRRTVTANGKTVTYFNMATNESFKDSQGEKISRTDWHHICTWGKTAEACSKFLKKGSKVFVEGKIRNLSNKDEEKIFNGYEIFATDVTFVANFGESREEVSDQ
jgi:single-strand DNA-binding protein